MTDNNQNSNYQSPHHSFNIQYAKKYGIDEAILIHHFQHWINHNQRLNRNNHDGRTWTYQTLDEIAAHFPYWTKSQVYEIIEKLCLGKNRRSKKINLDFEPVLMKGNYNKHKYDTTTWYAFKNEEMFTELANAKKGVGKCQNGNQQMPTPIPDTITDTKTNKLSVADEPVGSPPEKIKVKTKQGDIYLDETDLYSRIVREKVSWSSEEIAYAKEALVKYDNIVHDWFRFLEGAVMNYRDSVKSKNAARGCFSRDKQNNSKGIELWNLTQERLKHNKTSSEKDLSEPHSQKQISVMEALQKLSQNG